MTAIAVSSAANSEGLATVAALVCGSLAAGVVSRMASTAEGPADSGPSEGWIVPNPPA